MSQPDRPWGHFQSELELYQFFDWLEFWVAPRKHIPKAEAHEKAHLFVRSLRNSTENPLPGAVACLNQYRQWRQTNPPINLLEHF